MASNTTEVGIKISAQDQASSVFTKVAASAGELKNTVGGLGEKFSALAGTAIAGFSAISFANKIKETINLADGLNKLSQKTGIATEELSKLQYAAGLADVSNEALSTGLKKLNNNISLAANGSKAQADVFKALGVNVRDASGQVQGADKVIAQLADRFAESADGANKTAVAIALLGKNGNDLIPLLNGGSKSLKDLGKEAEKLGIVIGSDFAKNAEEFNDNLHKLSLAGQGLFVTLAGDLVKGLAEAAKAMSNAAIEGGKLAGIWAGLKTLMSGSQQFQNDKALSETADQLGALENSLARLRNAGYTDDTLVVRSQLKQIDALKQKLALIQQERKELAALQVQEEKSAPAKPGSTKVDAAAKVLGQAGAGESPFDAINKKLQERLAVQRTELDLGRQLTEQEKFSASIQVDIKAAKDKVTAAQKEQLAALVKTTEQEDLRLQIARSQIADAKAAAAARQQFRQQEQASIDAFFQSEQAAYNASNQSIKDGNAALQDEIDALGLSSAALARHQVALIEDSVAEKQAEVDRLRSIDSGKERADQLEIEIRLLKERAGLITGKATKEANEAEREEGKRTADYINNELTDAFIRATDSGKSAFVELRDTAVNLFKNLPLRVVLNAALNPISGAISGALGAAGLANTGTALGGIGGAVGLAGTAGVFGSGLGAGFSALFNEAGLSGALSAAGTAIGAGNIAGGIGTAVGALGPYALAAAAIYSLLKGNGGTPTSSTGDSNATFDPMGKVLARNVFGATSWTPTPSSTSEAVVAQLGQSYQDTIKALGIKAVQTNFSFSGNTGKDGKSPNFAIGGAAGSSSFYTGEIAQTDDAVKLATSRALLAAIQGSDLPSYLSKVFDGLTPSAATQDQIDKALAAAQAMADLYKAINALPDSFKALKAASVDAIKGLADASGGLDQLSANLSAYYEKFATDEEKRADNIAAITRALNGVGFSVTADQVAATTRDQFKGIVQAALAGVGTEGGQAIAAAVLGIVNQFDQLVPAAKDAGDAVDELAKQLEQTLATRKAWQDKVDVLLGRTTQRAVDLQNDLSGVTDAATQAFIRQYYAQLDLADASKAAADAIAKAAESSKAEVDAAQQRRAEARAAAAGAVDAALDGVGRAVDKQKQALQDAFDTLDQQRADQLAALSDSLAPLQSVSGALRGALDSLDAQAQTTAQSQAEALATLRQALAGGVTAANSAAVQRAVGNVGRISSNDFSSRADYLAALGVARSTVAALGDSVDATLTTGQQTVKELTTAREQAAKGLQTQLKALDNQYAAQREAVSLLRGIDTSVKTLPEAIAALTTALNGERALQPGNAVASAFTTFGLANSGKGNTPVLSASYLAGLTTPEAARGLLASVYGDSFAGGDKFAASNYLDPAKLAAHADDIAALADYVSSLSAAQRDAFDPAAKRFAHALGLPGFAVGANLIPQEMLALLHPGEAVVPAAFNPAGFFGPVQLGNEALLAKVGELCDQVATLQGQLAAVTANTASTANALNGQQPRPLLVKSV